MAHTAGKMPIAIHLMPAMFWWRCDTNSIIWWRFSRHAGPIATYALYRHHTFSINLHMLIIILAYFCRFPWWWATWLFSIPLYTAASNLLPNADLMNKMLLIFDDDIYFEHYSQQHANAVPRRRCRAKIYDAISILSHIHALDIMPPCHDHYALPGHANFILDANIDNDMMVLIDEFCDTFIYL